MATLTFCDICGRPILSTDITFNIRSKSTKPNYKFILGIKNLTDPQFNILVHERCAQKLHSIIEELNQNT